MVVDRVVDDGKHHLLADGQSDGDAGEREAVDEVGGAVNGVDHPGRLLGQDGLLVGSAHCLLANELVGWEGLGEARDEELL